MFSNSRSKRQLEILLIAITGLLPVACLSPEAPKSVGPDTGGSSSSSSGTSSGTVGSSSSSIATFQNAGMVKVVFNKTNFFTNQSPNNLGCAGDAKKYYDPQTDRAVPVQPTWLKNVAVELTNSNAQGGPSNASACALSGLGSPEAKNCAAFDDLQPLSGEQSRSILVGGFGCSQSIASCSQTDMISDVWNLAVPEDSTDALWIKQSAPLPVVSTVAGANPGLIWHGGDYDELHDQFYVYGGATPNTASATGTAAFSNKIVRLTFGSDKSISTDYPPVAASPSTRANYAGWSSVGSNIVSEVNLRGINNPPALAGHTFTYGLRRDASMKSYCQENTSGCLSSSLTSTSSTYAIAVNEHEDYFLLAGGLANATTAEDDFTTGLFSRHFYLYKPHGFSNDVGTNGSTPNADGDWMLLSNIPSPTLGSVSTTVMSVVDLVYDSSSSSAPFQPRFVNETRPDSVGGGTFDGWLGRAYHRTVYDPSMNRFYIFGGLQNSGSTQVFNSGSSATTTVPDLATSDVWVYDPPALGRRPTAACFTAETPDDKTLPIGSTGSVDGKVLGTNLNLGPNRSYTADSFVFPPGGCLQRIKTSETEPDARFEHAMAFDRDQRVMLVFGGCTSAAVIPDSGAISAGNPLANCTANSLLNDTWVYVPPKSTEIVPYTYRSTTAGPYNASTLLANIFTTDFWLDFFDLFFDDNSPSSGSRTSPDFHDVLGGWVQLTPTGILPSVRASAPMTYDRAHHKYYLQGGYGCVDTACTSVRALNDLWEFTPPDFDTECDVAAGTCSNQGRWTKLRDDKADENGQPTQRLGAVAAFAEPQIAYGDDFYTVSDSACINQGPIAAADSSVSKQFVGAIYIDIDRDKLGTSSNLLINLRFLPFGEDTKAPAYSDNNTPFTTVDDTDSSSTNDRAVIRVQVMNNPITQIEQIQSLIQPRYHEFISGAEMKADTFMYVSGPNGQVTEKQILIPLTIDSEMNMIKIERVQGSVKFYEMTVSKF